MDGTIGQEFHIYTKVQTEWQDFEIPIPAEFDGKTVYFGFRHCTVSDMFILYLDDLQVTASNQAIDPGSAFLSFHQALMAYSDVRPAYVKALGDANQVSPSVIIWSGNTYSTAIGAR